MKYDVFISYSRTDNAVLQKENRWVVKFHEALHYWLNDSLKREPNIFYDELEMRGNDRLTQKIETALQESLILLPIVSSNYLNSSWCKRELEYFKNLYNAPQEVKSRIFPVVKTLLTKEEKNNLPSMLDDNIYSEFFSYDVTRKKLQLFDPIFGGERENNFFLLISDLARQIAEFIKETEEKSALTKSTATNVLVNTRREKSALIYLAEPSPDLSEMYNEIKRDLEQRRDLEKLKFDFFIPEPKKSTDEETYRKKVTEDVKKCHLVVNLIGRETNSYPKKSTKSHLQIQVEAAAERDGNPDFTRLVWIPRNAVSEDADFQNFIDDIRLKGVCGDGLMQDSFEKFKSRVVEILVRTMERLDNKPNVNLTLPPDESWFYVLCDKSDLETVRKVEDLLQDNKYAIFSSADYLERALGGDPEVNVFKDHNDYLARCNAVIIFWDKARIPWIRKNVFDLQGSAAIRKGQSIDFQVVILDGDLKDRDKLRFRTPPPKNCYKINYEEFSKILSQASTLRKD